jgi:hypothetical protein
MKRYITTALTAACFVLFAPLAFAGAYSVIGSVQTLATYNLAAMEAQPYVEALTYHNGSVEDAGGGKFVLTTWASGAPTPDGNIIIAPADHPGTCADGCMVRQIGIAITPPMFGAYCQGTAYDDSAALAAFLTWFLGSNSYDAQSSGNCAFATPLSASYASAGAPLKTLRFIGDGIWTYTGSTTASAITITNTGESASGAMQDFQNFSIDISNGNATYGLDLQNFNLSRWSNPSCLANNNVCFRLENTLAWSENNTFDKPRCVSFKRCFEFDVSGTGTNSFARTTIKNLFGAEGTNTDCWIYTASGTALYDSTISNIGGNQQTNSSASFACAQGSWGGTTIDGIKVEGSGTSGYIVANMGPFGGASRGPRVLDWLTSEGGFSGGVTSAPFADTDSIWDHYTYPSEVTPVVKTNSIFGTIPGGGSAQTVIGSAINFAQVTLTNTTGVQLTGLTSAKGSYLIIVSAPTLAGAPMATFSITANVNAGGATATTITSADGYSDAEKVSLTWTPGNSYPTLAKSGTNYNGAYNVIVIGD